ncbi:hypothetical protein OY033_002385 [Shigella flexneri]|nr:hypothetical protein [Shigella flexneri]
MVNINAIATKAISQAFGKSLKDAVLPFTGSRKGFGGDGGVYDPIRDEYVSADGTTGDISYTGRGVFGKFSDSELLNNGIDVTDTKLTCLVAEVSEIPKVDDMISVNKLGEKSLRVMNVSADPTNTAYSIQLRGI